MQNALISMRAVKNGDDVRVNIYAEEMTDKVEIISKEIDGHVFTGLRLYLELPVTVRGQQYKGPFIHRFGDDDSSAVTFWGKRDLRVVLRKMLAQLDEHYDDKHNPTPPPCKCTEAPKRPVITRWVCPDCGGSK
jgi:hypothetical protein